MRFTWLYYIGRAGAEPAFSISTAALIDGLRRLLKERLTFYITERMYADGLVVAPSLVRSLPK